MSVAINAQAAVNVIPNMVISKQTPRIISWIVVTEWLFPRLHPPSLLSSRAAFALCRFFGLYFLRGMPFVAFKAFLLGLERLVRCGFVCDALETVATACLPEERLCQIVAAIDSTFFICCLFEGRPRLLLPPPALLRPRFVFGISSHVAVERKKNVGENSNRLAEFRLL